MKVAELVRDLQRCSPTAEVLMSSDPEGNDTRKMASVEGGANTTIIILWPGGR